MPITLLDVILLVVMLISALLAMGRGVLRTMLGILCCAVASVAATGMAVVVASQSSSGKSFVGMVVVEFVVFVCALVVAVIIAGRLSRQVFDRKIGAIDRAVGFLAGVPRGLLIMVVPLLFFVWLVPDRSQPDWITDAKSRQILQETGQWLLSLLPEDPDSRLLGRLTRPPNTNPGGRFGGSATDVTVLFLLLGSLLSPMVDVVAVVAQLARPERRKHESEPCPLS
jgi:membrane protein required for colicin V production